MNVAESFCSERRRHSDDAINKLNHIIRVTELLIDANKLNDSNAISLLDVELEHAIAAKERAFEAFHQHIKDHGC